MSSLWAPDSADERHISKIFTFDGAAGNGAIGTVAVFTVPGAILIHHMGVTCTTDLVGATATISLGIAGDEAGFIAVTTATLLDAGLVWANNTPTAGILAEPAVLRNEFISSNIIFDILVANITAGVLAIELDWEPIDPATAVS